MDRLRKFGDKTPLGLPRPELLRSRPDPRRPWNVTLPVNRRPHSPAIVSLIILAVSATACAGPGGRRTIVDFLNRPDDFFKSDEGKKIADNIPSSQNANGGWWNNYDPTH